MSNSLFGYDAVKTMKAEYLCEELVSQDDTTFNSPRESELTDFKFLLSQLPKAFLYRLIR